MASFLLKDWLSRSYRTLAEPGTARRPADIYTRNRSATPQLAVGPRAPRSFPQSPVRLKASAALRRPGASLGPWCRAPGRLNGAAK